MRVSDRVSESYCQCWLSYSFIPLKKNGFTVFIYFISCHPAGERSSLYPSVLGPAERSYLRRGCVLDLLSHLSWEAALISLEAQLSGSWLQKEELLAGACCVLTALMQIAATPRRLPLSLMVESVLCVRSKGTAVGTSRCEGATG